MRKSVLSLAVLLSFQFTFAQSGNIQGNISDTSEHKPLSKAVISLLRPADSVLVVFTRSRENGDFVLNNVKPGAYLMMVTYPKFADYVEEIKVQADELRMGKINLIRKSELLKEVVVSQ